MEESVTSGRTEKTAGSSRKHRKRANKKSHVNKVDSWCGEDQTDINDPMINPGLDYGPMFWQQSAATVAPHVAPIRNGQRLFTTMSDPSVCGYSTVPVAYAMEPLSMPPIYPLYRPVPQTNYRPPRGRPRRNIPQHQGYSQSHQGISNISNVANGYSSLQENRTSYSNLYQNGDYTSLPPSANNHIVNESDDLNSEHRRYSDPGLGPADLPPYTNSEDSDTGGSSTASITTIGKNNKLVLSLVEQMTALREANSQMFKQLNETKLTLENVTTELAEIKQNAFSDYQPGMLSDIISEIRQANKALDETIDARIKFIVEEKTRQKLLELDDLKEQLAQMTEQKAKGDRRIANLEEEVASLKINASNIAGREIAAFEEETLTLRRELQEARARNTDNQVAKCVEASSIARSIKPLSFNTPCITSTPVRTNFHELKSSSSILPASSSSSTSTDSSPSPLSPSDSSRNLENVGLDHVDEEWQWKQFTVPGTEELPNPESSEHNHLDEKQQQQPIDETTKESKESIDKSNCWKNSRSSDASMKPDEREAFERLLHFHFERDVVSAPNFYRTAVVRRKSDTSNSRKISKFSCLRAVSTNSISSEPKEESNPKKNEENGVEVPDVVVVPEKSVVPKNLCSTRILTSSVLKAPSRATFTTAYI